MNNDKIDLALFSNENKVEIAKKTETEIVKTMMFNQGSNDLRSQELEQRMIDSEA